MITKKKLRGGQKISVTFKHEGHAEAEIVEVVGDFNEWTGGTHVMKKRKDGTWSVTLRLPRRGTYEFRYLADGEEWFTEEEGASIEVGPLNAVLVT